MPSYQWFLYFPSLHLHVKPAPERCLRFRPARHSLGNRHHGIRFHVSPQHIPDLPINEELELGAVGESYAHFGWVSESFPSTFSPLPLKSALYDFKSFAWIVATLFGITGYATFTTLSQGNLSLHSSLIVKDQKLFPALRRLARELLLWRHEPGTRIVLRQHSANISARMLCVARGNFN